MKKVFLFLLGMSILLLNISCTSYVVEEEKLHNIKSNPHGTIKFLLKNPYDIHDELTINANNDKPKHWLISIEINKLKYVANYYFEYDKVLSFPVPEGELIIEYTLYSLQDIVLDNKTVNKERIEHVMYRTEDQKDPTLANNYYGYASIKKLCLNIKAGETKLILIKKTGERKSGDAFADAGYIGWTDPVLFQEVCFELEGGNK